MTTTALETGLRGPFPLSTDAINDEIVEARPGAFALGYIDNLGRFCVTYVGSATQDLKARLKERIGTAQQFKYRHLASDRSAFEKECELFHDFRPHGNFLHPSRPAASDWTCPRCRPQPSAR